MTVSPILLQFLGSLGAIIALAWLARRLGLGPGPVLADEAAARRAIEEAAPGFRPLALALDTKGHGAIARDGQGRILLLRPHGAHFAGRLLTPQASARQDGEVLVIDTAEKRYGTARLALADASAWVQAIAAMRQAHHA